VSHRIAEIRNRRLFCDVLRQARRAPSHAPQEHVGRVRL